MLYKTINLCSDRYILDITNDSLYDRHRADYSGIKRLNIFIGVNPTKTSITDI